MEKANKPEMNYELQIQTTSSGVGYFACVPCGEMGFETALDYLRKRPLDAFMHRHVLEMVSGFDKKRIRTMLAETPASDPVLRALFFEAVILDDSLETVRCRLDRSEADALCSHTPLIYLKWFFSRDRELHRRWTTIFESNLLAHRPLPSPDELEIGSLFRDDCPDVPAGSSVHIRDIVHTGKSSAAVDNTPLPSAAETAATARERLEAIGVFADVEMRHVASLSPIALLRSWRIDLPVRSGQLDYRLSGIQTSYGKGLSLDAARASYLMEIVERCSSFAGIGPEGVLNRETPLPAFRGTYSELQRRGIDAIDPNRLGLEVPYRDEPIYWIEGEQIGTSGSRPCRVPAQCIFLFCNLDEVSLFSGLGSTGLASGNTVAEAKVSGLLEAIERDCESITPFDPQRCFLLDTTDPALSRLFADYRYRGIHPVFQDLTPDYGVPCYKCFVATLDGGIAKGTGAHLDGRRAALSALTETPFPYPYGPRSVPEPAGLPVRRLEELPSYSAGCPDADLKLLESVLPANGFSPVYVNLTRADLRLPVIRAIVPGMELLGDFDQFSRVNPRLFANYLRLVTERELN